MSHTQVAFWLLAYDIADKRRLARVYRRLKKEGVPVQYSIFQLQKNPAQMGALMAQLSRLIDPREDDVRAYRIPSDFSHDILGDSLVPDSIWLSK